MSESPDATRRPARRRSIATERIGLGMVLLLAQLAGPAAAAAQTPGIVPGSELVDGRRISPYVNTWQVVRVGESGSRILSTWHDEVTVEDVAGREVLKRVQHVVRADGKQRDFYNAVDRRSLAPIRYREGPSGSAPDVDLFFDGAQVSGHRRIVPHNQVGTPPVPVEIQLTLPEPAFDWQLWGLLAAALPLDEDLSVRFLAHISSAVVESPLIWVTAEVIGQAQVPLPGGATVPTWIVRTDAGVPWTLWIARDPAVPPIVQICIPGADGSVRWWIPSDPHRQAPPELPGTCDAGQEAGTTGLDKLREAYLDAYNEGDADAIADVYVADAVRMPYDAPAQETRDSIVDFYRRSFATRPFQPTLRFVVEDVRVSGGRAIERGRYIEVLRPRDGGATLREEGKYIVTARSDSNGTWRYEWTIFNRDGRPTPIP